MENVLRKINEITSDPYAYVSQHKEEKGKKVVGCFPMHIPEEMIHAAGMIPVVMWRGNERVTWGHAHVPPYDCGITRSFVDDAVRGKLGFMDGMAFHVRQCLQAGEFPFIMKRHVKPDYLKILYLPALYPGNATRNFTLKELESFKNSLEAFGGTVVKDDDLRESIEIYNENRKLLERVYEIRRERPEVLKAREMMQIVWSGMLMLKEDHNELLKELIKGMEGAPGEPKKEKIKVIPVGCLCQTLQFDILDIIEDLGMIVPDDDLYIGSRYFANPVALNGDPIAALADRYLAKTPLCPTKGVWDIHWGDEAIARMKANGAKGIISLMVKYCPPHTCYYPDFKSKMEREGVNEVMIQIEHEIITLEAIKTRLQSFAEMIGGV
ncbi:MAG: 2-hydroxyacyl-CoA dehydratase family protein [Desulfatiglans sp.]|jgi:benzoyl-CoA reductase subunit C|nr:2-hydroxyacyl-CoA dehydratase family protein [Desulfatiglans sp.]